MAKKKTKKKLRALKKGLSVRGIPDCFRKYYAHKRSGKLKASLAIMKNFI